MTKSANFDQISNYHDFSRNPRIPIELYTLLYLKFDIFILFFTKMRNSEGVRNLFLSILWWGTKTFRLIFTGYEIFSKFVDWHNALITVIKNEQSLKWEICTTYYIWFITQKVGFSRALEYKGNRPWQKGCPKK